MPLAIGDGKLTGIADQDVDMIHLFLDLICGSFHVVDICQITWNELHTVIVFTERDSLAVSPIFAGGVKFVFISGHDKYFCDAMKQELCGDL